MRAQKVIQASPSFGEFSTLDTISPMNNQMKTVFHIQFEGNSDPITRKAYLQIERYWDIDLTRKMPGLFDQIKLA